ncbi:hypothetical protein BDN71DRAFT_1435966 [Pleurotus eryngii]|uniref:JmjC domain-containing protein n=1 Tax=Pleurotus eryngii TaxID=5323 RepID=A0A9P6D2K3_PLEER|nr:hypothetical protein BDN71DRAFT_1435966 [Pleurotus eryngii]
MTAPPAVFMKVESSAAEVFIGNTSTNSSSLNGTDILRQKGTSVYILEATSSQRIHRPGAKGWQEWGYLTQIGDIFRAVYVRLFAQTPPLTLGNPGDIWVDTHGCQIYYSNNLRVWQPWNGNNDKVFHPIIIGYELLWDALKQTISWASATTAKRRKTQKNNPCTAPLLDVWNRLATIDEAGPKRPRHIGITSPSFPEQALATLDSDKLISFPDESPLYPIPSAPHDASLELLPTAMPTYTRTWKQDSIVRAKGVQFPDDTSIDEDIMGVRFMLQHGKDATLTPLGEQEPPVLVLDASKINRHDRLTSRAFCDQIHMSLSTGRPVLVNDFEALGSDQIFNWSVEEWTEDLTSPEWPVIWQDAELRARGKVFLQSEDDKQDDRGAESSLSQDPYWIRGPAKLQPKPKTTCELGTSQGSTIHRIGKLKDFVASLESPTTCGNLLDCVSFNGEIPWFVRQIRDHMKSLEAMEKRNYANYKSSERAAGKASLRKDMFALNEWKLVTSAGFLTHPHHDAGGLCTWITMKSSLKIWGILRPKVFTEKGIDFETGTRRFLSTTEAILNAESTKDHADLFILMMTPSAVLLQPPGFLHLVYSPIQSIALGGHFLTHESLHLTAWSRRIEHTVGTFSTNAEHPCVECYLARMMLCLEFEAGQSRPCKPLLALALMILDNQSFTHESILAPQRTQEWKNELAATTIFAKTICIRALKLKQSITIPALCKATGSQTSNIIESLHADVNQEGVNCTLVGRLKKVLHYDTLKLKMLQTFHEKRIRPLYAHGHISESITRSMKRKVNQRHGNLASQDESIEKRNQRHSSRARAQVHLNEAAASSDANAVAWVVTVQEKAEAAYRKALAASAEMTGKGSGKILNKSHGNWWVKGYPERPWGCELRGCKSTSRMNSGADGFEVLRMHRTAQRRVVRWCTIKPSPDAAYGAEGGEVQSVRTPPHQVKVWCSSKSLHACAEHGAEDGDAVVCEQEQRVVRRRPYARVQRRRGRTSKMPYGGSVQGSAEGTEGSEVEAVRTRPAAQRGEVHTHASSGAEAREARRAVDAMVIPSGRRTHGMWRCGGARVRARTHTNSGADGGGQWGRRGQWS